MSSYDFSKVNFADSNVARRLAQAFVLLLPTAEVERENRPVDEVAEPLTGINPHSPSTLCMRETADKLTIKNIQRHKKQSSEVEVVQLELEI